jgi:hypothetical protein
LNNQSRFPSRRDFLGKACALTVAPFAAAGAAAETRAVAEVASQPSFAPGLSATKIDSLQLSTAQRAFLMPIAALWEVNVGNATPVTQFHIEAAAHEPGGK